MASYAACVYSLPTDDASEYVSSKPCSPSFNCIENPQTTTLPHVQCYCPYTRCAAGVAIVTRDGRVSSGGYVESAAYNPGLPPFQAAIVAAIIGGMPSYDQVPVTVRVPVSRCAIA